VTTRRVGNQKHYQANPAAPVFAELRALVLKTSGLTDHLRSALAPRASEIRAAFAYGSVAKGDDATSDVDVMIISDHLTYSDLFPLLDAASKTIGRAVNPTVYSTADLANRIEKGNAFVTWTLKQPKIWLIGSHSELPA
jgi:predicted nucleotidyltransferase